MSNNREVSNMDTTERNRKRQNEEQPAATTTKQPRSEERGTDDITIREPNPNPNANANPSNNVIPLDTSSRSLESNLLELRKTQTKYTKVDHHVTFLTEAITSQIVPTGLSWNITVNVMETNDAIEEKIQKHLKESALELCEILRSHYDDLESQLDTKRITLENTIANMTNTDNENTVKQSLEEITKEHRELYKKLHDKRERKLNNLKRPPPRNRRPSRNLNYLPVRHQQFPTHPQYHQQYYHHAEREYQWVPPPTRMPPPPREPPPEHRYRTPGPSLQQQQQQQPQQQTTTTTYDYTPARNQTENNLGAIVDTFARFLTNLQTQTGQLLSSFHQLNSLQKR